MRRIASQDCAIVLRSFTAAPGQHPLVTTSNPTTTTMSKPTSPDYRALCAELLKEWDAANGDQDLLAVADVIDRARILLAQPEPEGVGDATWFADFAAWLAREMPAGTVIGDPLWWAPRIARAAIARYSHPTIQPVPQQPLT